MNALYSVTLLHYIVLLYYFVVHCKKKVSGFSVPSQGVTNR
jgi:hypothetical protein